MRRELHVVIAAGLMSFLIRPAIGADPTPDAVAGKMAGVTDELNRKQTGKPVQTEQKGIVKDLDQMIAKLEKLREGNRTGLKDPYARQGMKDSMISRGPGGIGDLVNPEESNKDWAKLSTRERDRILQSMSEGFPPEYRMVLERYYRRLAEEKRSPAADAAPDAKKADASKEAAKKP
jgi:hypothetical protein